MAAIFILFYLYFLKNHFIFNYMCYFIFSNLRIIFFFSLVFLFISAYFFSIYFSKIKFIGLLSKKNINLYFFSRKNVFLSCVFVLLFLFYYFFYLKIMLLFAERQLDVNIFLLKAELFFFIENQYYIVIAIILFLLYLLYLAFYFFNFLAYLFAKYHYLRLHYYFFSRIFFYRKIIDSIQSFEIKLLEFFGGGYLYFVFFKFYFLKFVLAYLLIHSVFFCDGNLFNFLKFIPFYSFYFFIFNIHKFILHSLKHDFDVLIIESYYKEIDFIMEINDKKKSDYITFLITGFSKFRFEDCGYLYFPNQMRDNFVTIQINKYTINSYPNDFYSRIKNAKPEFLKKSCLRADFSN